jgi:hypothetical protein
LSKLRLKISTSLDGFVAGPDQSVNHPLGVGGMRLHEWAVPLRAWRSLHGLPGGEANESSQVVEESFAGIGATIMGRNMFGGHPGPWNAGNPWNGWWGAEPPCCGGGRSSDGGTSSLPETRLHAMLEIITGA